MEQELLEDLKRYLNVENDEQDELLLDLLLYAESIIYSSYNVAIFSRELTENILPDYGERVIYTPKGHIYDIVEFSVNDTPLNVYTDLVWNRNKIIIKNTLVVLNNTDSVSIVYLVGWEDKDEVPKALLNALFVLVKKLWNDSTKDTDMLSSISTGIRESVRPVDEIPVLVETTLNSFRIIKI